MSLHRCVKYMCKAEYSARVAWTLGASSGSSSFAPHGSIWDRVSQLLTFWEDTDSQSSSPSSFQGPSPATPSLNATSLFSWLSPGVTERTGDTSLLGDLLDLFSSQGPSSQLKIPWRREQRQSVSHPRKTKTALLGNEQCPG